MMNKISIVIPLYNKEKQIEGTLKSVLSQTFSDFEIVIVDDGSTDHSADVVEGINDPRIRLIRQINSGVSAARNRGIEEAKYELIALLDGDDEWKPNYLETQVELVRKYPQCDVFCCNYEFRDSKYHVTSTTIRKLKFSGSDGLLENYFEVASCSHPPISSISIVVRKSAIQAVGGFPVGIKSGEDLLTWAKLAVRFQIAYSTKPVAVVVFDERVFNNDQTNRMPEQEDFVGKQLAVLSSSYPRVKGLKDYVGMWHKMRARIFLSKHIRWKALQECEKSMRYSFTLKIVIFSLLAFTPSCFIDFVFKKIG